LASRKGRIKDSSNTQKERVSYTLRSKGGGGASGWRGNRRTPEGRERPEKQPETSRQQLGKKKAKGMVPTLKGGFMYQGEVLPFGG